MPLRPRLWLGLLLGGLMTFGLRRQWLPTAPISRPAPLLDLALDLVGEAVVVCDAEGGIMYTNAAARALFGADGQGLSRLCYPSGQPVPPGQMPLRRALRTGKTVEGTGYLLTSPDGAVHVLDILAHSLAEGGTAATIREITAMQDSKCREASADHRDQVLRQLCRRLGEATSAESLARALVEGACALVGGLPQTRARLYLHDVDNQRLTRLASAPDTRRKRPQSHRQAQPPMFPFDATVPLLWSLYIAREASVSGDVAADAGWAALGEETAGSAYALPLLAGGVALGHLSVTCPSRNAFEVADLREAFGVLASVAAFALAGPQQAARADHLSTQVAVLRDVVQAVGRGMGEGDLADLVVGHICRVTGGEVCTLNLRSRRGLRLAGTAYRDALLFPERPAPDAPTTSEAVRTGKTVQRVGLANPSFEAEGWRAFAGQSGRHSVLAVPLAAGQGALTVFVAGDAAFPAPQITFVETLAALVSVALPAASRTGGHEGG